MSAWAGPAALQYTKEYHEELVEEENVVSGTGW